MVRRLFILAACTVLPVVATTAEFSAATAANQLGVDLYRQLAKASPDGNVVLSPYSIDCALAMVYSGAEGITRTEMAGALHFPADDSSLQGSFGDLRATLDRIARDSAARVAAEQSAGDNEGVIEWHAANRLFGQTGYAFRPAFLALMKDGYDAPFESLDFKQDAAAARRVINSWVGEQTRGKIRDVIPAGGITADARLVLVNALYLKAPWQKPFEESATRLLPFHIPGLDAPRVATMRRTDFLGYLAEPGFTVVALPYADPELHFLILLPDEGTECDALAGKLTPEDLQRWASLGRDAATVRVELYLPKFRVEGAGFPLGSALRALGLKRAFDEPRHSADFSRIAPPQSDEYLKLAEVFHKSFIAVDEHGTEAAAATAVVATFGITGLAPPPAVAVHVDRPFLFIVQHRASGLCLFLGRITDPR